MKLHNTIRNNSMQALTCEKKSNHMSFIAKTLRAKYTYKLTLGRQQPIHWPYNNHFSRKRSR